MPNWGAWPGAQILKELLESGAPVDLLDEAQQSPLHRACSAGHAACAAELIGRNADILLANGSGRTPILCAAASGSDDIVQLPLEASAQLPPDFKSVGGWGSNLMQHRVCSSDDQAPGMNALLLAAQRGHAKVVRLALRWVGEWVGG